MKRLAYVLMDDFVHTAKRNLPFVTKYFDLEKWQVCVFRNWDDVCGMTAPDVFLEMRDACFNWRQDTPNWYESDVSYRIAKFVLEEGSGYVAVHAGLTNIPEDHPIRTRILHGSSAIPEGGTPLHNNLLAGKVGTPFNAFSEVTFTPCAEHPVTKGIKAFVVRDEQYGVAFVPEAEVTVLGNTTSEEAGSSVGAWACEAGKGRAVGITLGHLDDALKNPMLQKLIANAVNWCGRETD